MQDKKNGKKQIPLRISAHLYAELERWAADEFRSVNGQIEYLLSECVRNKRKRITRDGECAEKENSADGGTYINGETDENCAKGESGGS